MDTDRWRSEQRRLRQAVRVARRTPDGRAPARSAPMRVEGPDVQAPDLLSTPIFSERGVGGPAIVSAKKLLRRLLGQSVLEPQSSYNRAVAAELAALRQEINKLETAALAATQHAGSQSPPIDYLSFEERFRGSSEDIESRQREYVDYFFDRGEVLDIGCGRGELLAMLGARGISARGVDLDEDMVGRCREQGLSADCADAVDFLETQADASFGGIFLSQVVEHLSTDYLVALLDAIRRKTARDAVLIIETINPESLPVLMRWFWLDPTHVRLVHPETLQFFMEQAGFKIKTVQFRRPVPDEQCLPQITPPVGRGDEFNDFNAAVAALNSRLFGPLDYFVVGQSQA